MTASFPTAPEPHWQTAATVPVDTVASLLEQIGGVVLGLHAVGRPAEAVAVGRAVGAFLDVGAGGTGGRLPSWRVSAAAQVAVDAVAGVLATAVRACGQLLLKSGEPQPT